jgi:hypothetical protein
MSRAVPWGGGFRFLVKNGPVQAKKHKFFPYRDKKTQSFPLSGQKNTNFSPFGTKKTQIFPISGQKKVPKAEGTDFFFKLPPPEIW